MIYHTGCCRVVRRNRVPGGSKSLRTGTGTVSVMPVPVRFLKRSILDFGWAFIKYFPQGKSLLLLTIHYQEFYDSTRK